MSVDFRMAFLSSGVVLKAAAFDIIKQLRQLILVFVKAMSTLHWKIAPAWPKLTRSSRTTLYFLVRVTDLRLQPADVGVELGDQQFAAWRSPV